MTVKLRDLALGTAAGMAAGALVSWAVEQSKMPAWEKMLHKKMHCISHTAMRMARLFGA